MRNPSQLECSTEWSEDCKTLFVMALRLPGRIKAAPLCALMLVSSLATAASTAGKESAPFDHARLSPITGTATAGLESAFPSTGSGLTDPENHPLLSSPYYSGAVIELASEGAVADEEDGIRPDPRPRMKKFMLIVLVLGALVKYLTSPSYLKFVSEVTDPWAS